MQAFKILTPTKAMQQKALLAYELNGLIDLGPAGSGYRLMRHVNVINYLLIDPAGLVIFTDDQGHCFADLPAALRYVRTTRDALETRPLPPLPAGIAPTPRRLRRAFDRAFLPGSAS